jgi:DNA recombination protein RmuC
MFVPSEAVYAELHDSFDDVVQKAYRAQVMMVSPTLLMLAIQVIRQIQKDARMREAADQIRSRGRPHDEGRAAARRARAQAADAFRPGQRRSEQILTSAGRIEKRAVRDRGTGIRRRHGRARRQGDRDSAAQNRGGRVT